MSDRVSECRRAAALARHYRDQEHLTIAEIARRLGRAEATVKAHLYDPTGEKARAVQPRYLGECRGCGAYMQPGWPFRRSACLAWSEKKKGCPGRIGDAARLPTIPCLGGARDIRWLVQN